MPIRLVPKPAVRRHNPSVGAHEALLRGRHHLFRFTPESWGQARPQLERAIALDPGYAEAHSELGTAYLLTGTNGIRRLTEVAPIIRDEAHTALALDPGETSPHYLLASVAALHDYDWRVAGEGFRSALASPLDLPYAHWAYASFYLQPLGRIQEAIAEMEREVERDPLNVPWRSILAHHLTVAELYDRAIETAKEALEVDERHWLANYVLAEAYALTGRFREAIAVAEKGHEALPSNSMPVGVLAGALANVGEKVRAEELIRQMGDAPHPIWGRVEYHLLCSEIDAAADWYERMIDVRDPFAVIFATSAIGRALRQSGLWPKLARMMNLPEAARNSG
jgi:tetratricopeptide (TPR) repeat protein